MDAIGSGGWGPPTSSTLVERGHEPDKAMGSINRVEVFVTVVQSITFIVVLVQRKWKIDRGFVLVGAPARRLPRTWPST